jgi:uncharacterized protein (TIGR00661 family)
MEPRSFIFAVQGEGRGHLTQAISVYDMLIRRGCTVHAILVGTPSSRELPEFFRKKIPVPVITFQSPHFTTDPKNKSIRFRKTIWNTFRSLRTYQQSLKMIGDAIDEYRPDALINFYEPLAGWYMRYLNTKARHGPIRSICIGHQYVYLHPSFVFPVGRIIDRGLIRWYTKMTARRSDALVALSFYPLPDENGQRLKVLPPLLRKEVFGQPIQHQPFLLAYVLNAGYMQDIIQWHKEHPDTELHCFTDSKAVRGKWRYDDTLCFHSLDDMRFLSMMASCQGLVCTAGFESVCEAMYLGKPVMMIPVGGHFEQFCNARDAAKAGAGIYDSEFRIDRLLDYMPKYQVATDFQQWIQGVENDLMAVIERAVPVGLGRLETEADGPVLFVLQQHTQLH